MLPSRHALVALAFLLTTTGVASAEPGSSSKVVVLGFDGADATITQRLMEAGRLPNLERLRQQGSFRPLETTNPPQTPVSWSTFATGTNPGRTTIFDFLKRQPKTYIPTFALMEEGSRRFLAGQHNAVLGAGLGIILGGLLVGLPLLRLTRSRWLALGAAVVAAGSLGYLGHAGFGRLLPAEIPQAINNRQGATLWDLAAQDGLRTRIIRVPATFPAPETLPKGRLLSGLGVPDVRGTVGTFSYYTTERLERTEDTEFGGKVVELDPFEQRTSTVVYGPRNKLFYKPDPRTHLDPEGDPREINLPLLLTRRGDQLELEVAGSRHTLSPGQWSDWIVFTFPFNRLIDLRAFGRFHLIELEPSLKLYLSPLNLHPTNPPIDFSTPSEFAEELHDEHGFYRTLGWSEDTWSYTESRISEEVFLADVEDIVAKEEAILLDLLAAKDYDLFIQVFTFTDRIAHVFWRLTDPEHPAYDAELARRFGSAIDDAYVRMDDLVGKAMTLVDPGTALLVVSDHGFATWRRSVNINTWLVQNGFMTLRSELGGRKLTLEDLFGNKKFWPYVDWSKTRAYALGLGNVYINLQGREPEGIVAEGAQYDALVQELKAGLEALVDPANQQRPVRRVYHRDEMYSGFDPLLIPDLRVANNPGYRVSWQSSLGATPREVFEDNAKPWSADHCSLDPDAVPGILFTSTPVTGTETRMVDVMPTVLQLLGVPLPSDLDGRPFL